MSLVLLAVFLSVVTSATTAFLVTSRRTPESRAAGTGEDSGSLAASLGKLAREQEQLVHEVAELREAASRPVADARVSLGDLDLAVARWMEEHGSARGGSDEPALAQESEPEPSNEAAVETALAKLLDPELDDVERQNLWRAYAAQGLTDALIAAYEKRAEREPNDPDRQVELGEAYLQKIFEVGNSPLAGVWATKADRAFDSALALDERHWGARMNKAVSLSFWPPVFGKQTEAIQHFETLVAQQAERESEPRFAQTHLLLGNMYQQLGDAQKAIGAWERGLERFPDDEDLAKQLALAKGQ